MKSDIQIAQEAKSKPIVEIARKTGIRESELEIYGQYKAKLKPSLWERIKEKRDGKLILVTATSPTPLGEGKTTTSVGLAMAMNKLGKKAVLALREPSLGPCMGIKGGAAGGGRSQVLPMEDINLHFTGDIHAITTANNLLSAMLDNHIYHGNALKIDLKRVLWKRCLDLNDRALRQVSVDLSRKHNKIFRPDSFNITVASEIMAILCLAENLKDLKKRLAKIVVAYDSDNRPVFAAQLKAVGAMAAVLKDALKPNLVQTLEHTPVIIHGGPFANIAHGCNSLLATRYGLKLGDYLITEAGFGADLGAEKFFNIKCRIGKLKPSAVVIVTTIRSLKYNGGGSLEKIAKEDLPALEKGLGNLDKHLENIQRFQMPVVVAINVFPTDTKKEISRVIAHCRKKGAEAAVSKVWERGGSGGKNLAQKVLKSLKRRSDGFRFLYDEKKDIPSKIRLIAREIYGAKEVKFSLRALGEIAEMEKNGFSSLPICMAKTQYSFSDDPKKLGRPENFSLTISEVRLSNGAGFIVALAGKIMTMPGLPKNPTAEKIDVSDAGVISGLF